MVVTGLRFKHAGPASTIHSFATGCNYAASFVLTSCYAKLTRWSQKKALKRKLAAWEAAQDEEQRKVRSLLLINVSLSALHAPFGQRHESLCCLLKIPSRCMRFRV